MTPPAPQLKVALSTASAAKVSLKSTAAGSGPATAFVPMAKPKVKPAVAANRENPIAGGDQPKKKPRSYFMPEDLQLDSLSQGVQCGIDQIVA